MDNAPTHTKLLPVWLAVLARGEARLAAGQNVSGEKGMRKLQPGIGDIRDETKPPEPIPLGLSADLAQAGTIAFSARERGNVRLNQPAVRGKPGGRAFRLAPSSWQRPCCRSCNH